MTTSSKTRPAGTPPALPLLAAGLQQAAAHPEERPGARISLAVDGGLPGQRYHFAFTAHPQGTATTDMYCELSGRSYRPLQVEPRGVDFAALIRAIDPAALLAADLPAPRFPPDSLVGRLEISDGRQTFTLFYMADPEQAKTAGFRLAEPAARAVDVIYAESARLLGAADLRP